jgi:2-polyprenyl-3-methyl-5-hydroxy-6-metoxy-1,4-benzoquinol methylase
MNRILKIINDLKKKALKTDAVFQTEEQYYEQLFIKNEGWNKPNPNNDELKRWIVIESFINEIENNHSLRILDLGCGRGWLTNLLSQYGSVLGIEPVGKVVEYAKKIFPKSHFLKGTTTDLIKEYSSSFDLIVSSEVIEHIPDSEKKQFAQEINVLLKKGGFLIITTPRKEIQMEWNKYIGVNQPVEDWITENDLKLLFEENGCFAQKTKRIPLKSSEKAPLIDVYQVCLFKKT